MIGKIVQYIILLSKAIASFQIIVNNNILYTIHGSSGFRWTSEKRKSNKLSKFVFVKRETWTEIVSGIIVNENDFFSRKQQNIFYSRTLRPWLHIKYVYKRFADSHYLVSTIKFISYT